MIPTSTKLIVFLPVTYPCILLGRTVHLIDTRNMQVNGKPVGVISDLAVSADGTVYFTSASNKWPLERVDNVLFEAENTGRSVLKCLSVV